MSMFSVFLNVQKLKSYPDCVVPEVRHQHIPVEISRLVKVRTDAKCAICEDTEGMRTQPRPPSGDAPASRMLYTTACEQLRPVYGSLRGGGIGIQVVVGRVRYFYHILELSITFSILDQHNTATVSSWPGSLVPSDSRGCRLISNLRPRVSFERSVE